MELVERVLDLLEPKFGRANADLLSDKRVRLEYETHDPQVHLDIVIGSEEAIVTLCDHDVCERHRFTADRIENLLDLFE